MATLLEQIATIKTLIEKLESLAFGDDTTAVEYGGVTRNSLQKTIKTKFDALQAMVQGRLTYETKSLMDAAGAPPAGELAEVWNDSTFENNGLYGWSGSAWVKSSYSVDEWLPGLLSDYAKSSSSGEYEGTETGLSIVDEAGNPVLVVSDKRLLTKVIEITSDIISHPYLTEIFSKFASASDIESYSDTSEIFISDESGRSLIVYRGDEHEISLPFIAITPDEIKHPAITDLSNRIGISKYPRYRPLTSMMQIIVTGQSLSTDTGTVSPISTTPLSYAKMFNGGADWNNYDTSLNTQSYIESAHASMVDLVEGATSTSSGETPSSGIAIMMQQLAMEAGWSFSDQQMLLSNPGIAGKSAAELSSSEMFSYVRSDISYADQLAAAAGESISLCALPIIQGEADSNTDPVEWSATWKNYKNKVEQIAGRGVVSPIIQSASTSFAIKNEQLNLSGLDGYCFATPIYHLEKAPDGIHLTNESAKKMGAYIGKAIYDEIYGSGTDSPLVPKHAVISGKYCLLVFDVEIEFDTSALPLSQNYGFQGFKDGIEVSIDSVVKAGPDAIRILCASEIDSIRYADVGDGTTAVQNLRASKFGNVRSKNGFVFEPTGMNATLHRWSPAYELTQES